MSSPALRSRFLVSDLFSPGEFRMVMTDLDRMVVAGCAPRGPVRLPAAKELGTAYFTERRELGVINVGAAGLVRVGGQSYSLDTLDCLYVGIEEPDVAFEAAGDGQPEFYLLSCPAHRKLATRKMTRSEASIIDLGDQEHASCRRIVQYICPGCAPSCQLLMGFTELESGSVWNTMPAHTHSRRSEIYFYCGLEDGFVVHLMGDPRQTRHLIVRDREGVLSPPWSIHSGAGTRAYRFIWGMAGENQDFADMDLIPAGGLL